jgi:hypothetical protein
MLRYANQVVVGDECHPLRMERPTIRTNVERNSLFVARHSKATSRCVGQCQVKRLRYLVTRAFHKCHRCSGRNSSHASQTYCHPALYCSHSSYRITVASSAHFARSTAGSKFENTVQLGFDCSIVVMSALKTGYYKVKKTLRKPVTHLEQRLMVGHLQMNTLMFDNQQKL